MSKSITYKGADKSSRYELMAAVGLEVVVITHTNPQPGFEEPVEVGLPLFGRWGYGECLGEAIDNLVYDDPCDPEEGERRIAHNIYDHLKSAYPELLTLPAPRQPQQATDEHWSEWLLEVMECAAAA